MIHHKKLVCLPIVLVVPPLAATPPRYMAQTVHCWLT